MKNRKYSCLQIYKQQYSLCILRIPEVVEWPEIILQPGPMHRNDGRFQIQGIPFKINPTTQTTSPHHHNHHHPHHNPSVCTLRIHSPLICQQFYIQIYPMHPCLPGFTFSYLTLSIHLVRESSRGRAARTSRSRGHGHNAFDRIRSSGNSCPFSFIQCLSSTSSTVFILARSIHSVRGHPLGWAPRATRSRAVFATLSLSEDYTTFVSEILNCIDVISNFF